ncbi:MAG: TrkH family potassium uptake protein [Acidobacteria bacterium]|nr:TrkH family potassium uptake protein [Acidobacteriota bacterium]MDA1233190.1 TrkH family potassium uptake protein [Acidobacteriota bacterium]
MIHRGAIGYVLGQFLLIFAAVMGVPLLYGAFAGQGDGAPLLYGAAVTVTAGGALMLLPRPARELNQREGLLLAVSTWLAICFFGCLPFYFSPHFASFTDAFFESVSGFTTTGATILSDVEVLSPVLQFWRCFTHWLGGLGIVLLGVAVLPLIGHGGMHLYRAEFSGATSEQLKPRMKETALALWKIYFSMTAVLYGLLRWAGMNNFDALCHTFSTLGTGGFSTRTASAAAFESPLIEYILIVFMILAGMSFVQHYRFWVERRPASLLRDPEVLGYVAITAAGTAVIAGVLIWQQGYALENGFRSALFQVSSIITTTGFVSDDFEAWRPLPQLILLALMFVGGCTGSTAGGLKVSRIMLLSRVVDREFKRMVERRGVFAVRLGGQVVPESTVQSLLNLVYLAFVVNFVSCLALAALGVDVLTAIAAVAASMFSVGPGLGAVGPLDNYGGLPALAKWVLCGDMIAGRLEFYTTIVILTPAFWRK